MTLSRLEEAAHGTKALRMESWVDLRLPVPPEEEQTLLCAELERRLAQIDMVIDRTARSTELLSERRSALITAAVTGQIDLREAA